MRENSAPLCTACIAAAIAAGFGAGWLAQTYFTTTVAAKHGENGVKQRTTVKSSTGSLLDNSPRLCECGFDLTGKGPLHEQRHRSGRQHRINMRRTRNPILVTANENEYRAAINARLLPTDVVLEVGCAEGLTTEILVQRARLAIGVDPNEELIAKGRARLLSSREDDDRNKNDRTRLHLHAADVFDKQALIKIVDNALKDFNPQTNHDDASNECKDSEPKHQLTRQQKRQLRQASSSERPMERKHAGKINKIWLDMSKFSEANLQTMVRIIIILEDLLRPELIVVNSDLMVDLVRRSYLPSSVIPGLTRPSTNTSFVIS
eukprot:CAMPEP_0195537878 /NCGR_PEP_ID=MMETSP0794_2-20130614/48809_1 /TAXON_ID=515487 /ORGANISM="Stephanopyxis turris, Strain CCMP 815" /LENGTH=319 /DNA_ID=CAMNT_0040671739 /DNA_START=68 /DNA_END=1027 /DNA_ORIENTATION=-